MLQVEWRDGMICKQSHYGLSPGLSVGNIDQPRLQKLKAAVSRTFLSFLYILTFLYVVILCGRINLLPPARDATDPYTPWASSRP